MVDVLPKCPKCGGLSLEMKKGNNGWRWVQNDGRSYHVGGKMAYLCGCGNRWEE